MIKRDKNKSWFWVTVLIICFAVVSPVQADWPQQAKLLAPDGAVEDYFGASVSISGDYAIVGAYFNDDDGDRSGSAYVFERDGTDWIYKNKLTASDAAESDYFGCSVSISGGYAIVGAYGDDDNGEDSGSAYIFKRTLKFLPDPVWVWEEQTKLTAPDGAQWEWFGHSVSISGDYAIVGAWESGDNGSAYIFERDGANWIYKSKLTASDGADNDFFGYSVSISRSYAIVSAHCDDDDGEDSGSAYIFKRTLKFYPEPVWVWEEQAKLTASDAAAGDRFGYSVSIDGDYAIVGAHENNDDGEIPGSAYIFVRDGVNWNEQVQLLASDGAGLDHFGYSVSICGNHAVVGFCRDDENGGGSGSVYSYRRYGTFWGQIDKLLASDGAVGDYFGYSVSISQDYVIVGAHADDDNGDESGSAYVFKVCPSVDLNNDCFVDFVDFAYFAEQWLQ